MPLVGALETSALSVVLRLEPDFSVQLTGTPAEVSVMLIVDGCAVTLRTGLSEQN